MWNGLLSKLAKMHWKNYSLETVVVRNSHGHDMQFFFHTISNFESQLLTFRMYALWFHKIGQHLLIRPARISKFGPVVVVFWISSRVNNIIDNRRTAKSFSTRKGAPSVHHCEACSALGFISKVPVVVRKLHLSCFGGDVSKGVWVSSGFKKKNIPLRYFWETVGYYCTCRTCPYDNEVKILFWKVKCLVNKNQTFILKTRY